MPNCDTDICVVLVAAGSGERLGAGIPKAFVPLHGETILRWALRAFSDHEAVTGAVVVVPAALSGSLAGELGEVPASCFPRGVTVVPGGSNRTESVRRGLAAVPDGTGYVLVHDAARPLVPATVISSVVEALRAGADAVVPVLPMADTVKRVARDATGEVVEQTIDRSALRRVQTPQGFQLAGLRQAYVTLFDEQHTVAAAGRLSVTDDAGVFEAGGGVVRTVLGDEECFKITTAHDLRLAELFLAAR